MHRLGNKVAIITGGAGGIGRATATRFAAAGARVIIVDHDADALSRALTEFASPAIQGIVADASDPKAVEGYIDEVKGRFGRIDVLFSNAGTEGKIATIADYPVEAFDRVLAVNVRGVFLSLKHAIPVMTAQQSGSIIITSSIAGLHGFAGLSAYVTSKHAVVGLMRSAVLELASAGVRVNTIHPSPIETRMMRSIEDGAAPGEGARAKVGFETMIPAGRYGTPEEVADLALFLASDESRFCSGGLYSVDGGMSVA